MNTKLTLNINDKIIKQAKIYAKSNKRSISKIVEEFLYSISNSFNNKSNNIKLSPITSELLGMIKSQISSEINYNDILQKSLEEKYL